MTLSSILYYFNLKLVKEFLMITVFLFLRHVQIIHKHNSLLSYGRSEHPLPPPVQLRHDDILCLVSRGSRREVYVVRDVPGKEI